MRPCLNNQLRVRNVILYDMKSKIGVEPTSYTLHLDAAIAVDFTLKRWIGESGGTAVGFLIDM
jgi:hypothetical protein